jgi:cellulose synthase/poly-beta-1,6-N-acetylglucosamine synthase-like glycosyltransferase
MFSLSSLVPQWVTSCVASETFWVYLFWTLWIHRYLRLIVHCISHWTYKSKPIPEKPSYTSDDVTVILPTIHNAFEEIIPCLQSILVCKPAKLILVTTYNRFDALNKTADSLRTPGFQHTEIVVLQVDKANKRLQVCEALKGDHVSTEIVVMADDDVEWPSTLMPHLLAPFEDPEIGGVGTRQRIKRKLDGPVSTRIWNWLGAAYIQRRNFEITATHNIDGGTSCMSGRTGAYRAEILQSHDFLEGFQTERWAGYILNADDDNFVTRWLVSHQVKTWIQYDRECEIETTLEEGMKFLYQCSRWARSNWRSNWTSLCRERYVLRQQPWCTYALHFATFTSLAFVIDPLLLLACWKATVGWDQAHREYAFWAQFAFMFGFTKVVKLVGLFVRNPSDLVYLPVSIVFGYFHGLIKLWALVTLNVTTWGSRADGDEDNSFRLQKRPRSMSLATPKTRTNSELARFHASIHRRATISHHGSTERPVLFHGDAAMSEKTVMSTSECTVA